jgi:hypothetical protein
VLADAQKPKALRWVKKSLAPKILTTQLWIEPYTRFFNVRGTESPALDSQFDRSHFLGCLHENFGTNLEFIQIWQNNMYILKNDLIDLLSTQLQKSVIFSPLKFAILKSFWGPSIISRTAINNEL